MNNHYLPRLEKAGLKVSALTTAEKLCEMVELKDHPWFFGCQFHPEFSSTPREGHPLFISYIEAAVEHARSRATTLTAPTKFSAHR